jgi:hypothetical protein
VTVNSCKQFSYFKKHTSVFIMCGMLAINLVSIFLADVTAKVLANRPTVRESGDSALWERLI